MSSQTDSPDLSCDVFLNYESTPETENFVSHLRTAFRRKGMKIFKGPVEFGAEAIKIARVCIIIFSKEYGCSARCLEELVEIQTSGRDRNLHRFYFPVFYHVSPDKLEELTQPKELKKLQASAGGYQVAVWKDALDKALGETGLSIEEFKKSNDEQEGEPEESYCEQEYGSEESYDVGEAETTTTRNESELVDAIVAEVAKRLIFVRDPKLIGTDARMERILSLLRMKSDDIKFRSVGIWGMVGIGKTTIADLTFKKISSDFEVSYFGRDLAKELRGKERYYLLDDFLSTALGGEIKKSAFAVKQSFIKKILLGKRILMVLDDVDYFRDVEPLVRLFGSFGRGSRVIITSRSRQVLTQCVVHKSYEVEKLKEDESCNLLCLHAFGKAEHKEEDRKQLVHVGRYAAGNPLVIQAFGSFFRGRPVYEWDVTLLHFRQPEAEACKLLDSFTRSYNILNRNEKQVFLDIACFFRGMHKDDFADFLDGCGFSVDIAIRMLADKSLVTLLSDNVVEMHNLFQKIGREIVEQESREPGRRSRLWKAEDIIDVLEENKGTDAIEGIVVEQSEETERVLCDSSILRLTHLSFARMSNLRLLKIHGPIKKKINPFYQPGGLDFFSHRLQLLHWEDYPFESLPCSFESENLVELNLPASMLVKLCEGTMKLGKLKKLRLSHSMRLLEIQSLSQALNLRSLDLERCSALRNIGSVIGDLPENLKELYLGGTEIREVPSSIENVAGLVKLDLKSCKSLEILPTNICKLKYLEHLNLSGSSKLERFPNISEAMESLQILDLTQTAIKELPPSISNFIVLEKIRWDKPIVFSDLPDSLEDTVKLKNVEFNEGPEDTISSRCKGHQDLGVPPSKGFWFLESPPYTLVELRVQNAGIKEIPEDIRRLVSLIVLDLSRNKFYRLPVGIKQLSNLQKLKLSCCTNLRLLPQLPKGLVYLDAHGCTSLQYTLWLSEQFPSNDVFPDYGDLEIDECKMLDEVLTNTLKRKQDEIRHHKALMVQESSQPPSLFISLPTKAYKKLLPYLQPKGFFTRLNVRIPSLSRGSLRLALFIRVKFERGFLNDAGFVLRCLYRLAKKDGGYETIERIFFCWSPDEDETSIEQDHTFIFYDYIDLWYRFGESFYRTMYLDFCPIDAENKVLSGCKVKDLVAYALPRETETRKMIVLAKRSTSDRPAMDESEPFFTPSCADYELNEEGQPSRPKSGEEEEQSPPKSEKKQKPSWKLFQWLKF